LVYEHSIEIILVDIYRQSLIVPVWTRREPFQAQESENFTSAVASLDIKMQITFTCKKAIFEIPESPRADFLLVDAAVLGRRLFLLCVDSLGCH
jgi:hypothetical protein